MCSQQNWAESTEFPYNLCLHTWLASPVMSIPQQSHTFSFHFGYIAQIARRPGMEPGPAWWKHGVQTIEPPGNSHQSHTFTTIDEVTLTHPYHPKNRIFWLERFSCIILNDPTTQLMNSLWILRVRMIKFHLQLEICISSMIFWKFQKILIFSNGNSFIIFVMWPVESQFPNQGLNPGHSSESLEF